MTIDDGRQRLAAIVTTPFLFADDVFENLRSRAQPIQTTAATYDADQEREMLFAMAREAEERLQDEAIFNRSYPRLVDLGRSFDSVSHAVAAETAIGHLYQIIARRGPDAILADIDGKVLAEKGVPRHVVDIIKRELIFHSRHERETTWTLGPDRSYFETVLINAGAPANDANITRLRHAYLELYAELLFDAESRYAATKSTIRDVLDILKSEKADAKPDAAHFDRSGGPVDTIPFGDTIQITASIPSPSVSVMPPDPTMSASPAVSTAIVTSPISFTEKVAKLAARKLRAKAEGKRDGWTDKTAAQHLSIAKLFTKFSGTDDARLLSQGHIGGYRDLLDELPKSYGKSSRDFDRSIDEILARCEDLDDDEVGLAGGTVNRHLTQLNNCIAEVRGHGANIGIIEQHMRADGTPKERGSFTIEERETLFASSIWTGDDIIHGSAFFVPLIGIEDLLRLSEITGLLTEDIDLQRMIIRVRPNALRGLKNKSSIRDVPIMPETERTGFPDYVERIMGLGYKTVFPDLRLRGSATALSNLCYKDFTKILTVQLPHARGDMKSFHSFRKTGNTHMAAKNVNDPMRCQIMGHTYRDVNGKNYTDVLPIEDKRIALAHIPVTTSLVKALPIRLHPDLHRQ